MVASRLLMNVVEKQQQEWHSITATANTGHQGTMMELSILQERAARDDADDGDEKQQQR